MFGWPSVDLSTIQPDAAGDAILFLGGSELPGKADTRPDVAPLR